MITLKKTASPSLTPRRDRNSGAAAIEFGLMAPFLILLAVATVEIGTAVYEAMLVQNAAEAGAIYVAKHGFDVTGINNAITNATSVTGRITASPAPTQFYGCPTASGITTSSQGATCADGLPSVTYVKINTSITHTAIASFTGIVVPSTLTGEAIVRQ